MKRPYRYNSEWMPKGFKHDFDAHIYFKPTEIDVITGLIEDHTQGAVWLGQAVPLKLEVF